ncbi:MAG: DNA methyltransferase [Bacteroidia bacterium]
MSAAALDALQKSIQKHAQRLYEKLQRKLPSIRNEAELRRIVDPVLENFCEEIGLKGISQLEYTLASGRADAIFASFVIEYKPPGVLGSALAHPATHQAVEQLKKYLEELANKRKFRRVAGVVLDGKRAVFVRYKEKIFQVEPPMNLNPQVLQRMLRWLAGIGSGLAFTPENLERDFGIDQPAVQDILQALLKGLRHALAVKPSMVDNLYRQWLTFFSESIEYSEAFGGRKLEKIKKWADKAGLPAETAEEAQQILFVLHTYFALLVKLIAWLALRRHGGGILSVSTFGELLALEGGRLRQKLEEMEHGDIFRTYGLQNLLEGDFFAWYLYAWNKEIENGLRQLLQQLDRYDPTTLATVPEESRDLFKKLYHYLLPRVIRHNLGEYYTPDWLAQHLLERTAPEIFTEPSTLTEEKFYEKVLHLRWLDPACGSGTFLVQILARLRELGERLTIQQGDLLEALLKNVVGFDLNPLAVITARVNYLLAILDLLPHRRDKIVIPVYLSDSVRKPAEGETLLTAGAYEFHTAVGTFEIPEMLCKPKRFDSFCKLVEGCLQKGLTAASFLHHLGDEPSLRGLKWEARDRRRVEILYETLSELHRRGLNGLWARLLQNNFAPLAVGQFDYIVGNPPWINWEHLPDKYRQNLAPLWSKYELFPHKGFAAILGKSKDDISTLMTYVVADKLLKEGGRLGFVITQSNFKTIGGGKGFRRFRLPDGTPLKVQEVQDLSSFQPFEGASNRTATIVLEKGKPTTYPVTYIFWRKRPYVNFTPDSLLEEVKEATERSELLAEPIDPQDPTSPWLTLRKEAHQAVRKVAGSSTYTARAGAYTGGTNGVFWIEIMDKRPDGLIIVQNLTEDAKIKVGKVTEVIEPDLVYPLLRGRDVQRWQAKPSAWIILTHRKGMGLKAIPENEMQLTYPHTYGYLKHFESMLRARAAFKRYFTRKDKKSGHIVETGPFYSMFNVGDYTFAPWKVVWQYISSDFTVAVVGSSEGKPIVPNEKVMLIPCRNSEEAHYLCALLNSSVVRLYIRGFFIQTQIAPHVIQKISLLEFEANNALHQRLLSLSQAAHGAVEAGNTAQLEQIEAEIDEAVANLWGLTPRELEAMRESLRELS